MKKIAGLIFLSIFLCLGVLYASQTDRYPFVITTDTGNFTTSARKFWRWLETRIRFSSNTTATIWHIIDSGEGALHDTVISTRTISATTDSVIYPGATGDTAEVLLRNTDELKVVVSGTTNRPYVSIVGEEI